ncbi:MAG: hypothetical protein NUV51_09955, partial [Sulfuricaulis sp.]|nr:hypothetical protein [Sulfuricaulis sp.]
MTTTLTPEQMRELAERVEEIARYCSNDNMWDEGEVADLRTVVTMLREAAGAKPVAWIDEFGNAFPLDAWKPAKRTGYLDYHKKAWKPLFTHPAPQPQPEQHCAHERFGVAGNVFDSRGVARPYGTDTMSEMGIVPMCDEPERQPVSEPRPCTCHPDDNPPVPCAQKYALNECKAAVREPTEAQIVAATDAWQAHCGLLLLSREGARDEVMIVLRAALA